MGYAGTEESYLAGLLHDVGRLFLLSAAPDQYDVFFSSPDTNELLEVEQRLLGITHIQAAATIVERWNLDSFFADTTAC
jgi:HD-like signal output (HDOD) protein